MKTTTTTTEQQRRHEIASGRRTTPLLPVLQCATSDDLRRCFAVWRWQVRERERAAAAAQKWHYAGEADESRKSPVVADRMESMCSACSDKQQQTNAV